MQAIRYGRMFGAVRSAMRPLLEASRRCLHAEHAASGESVTLPGWSRPCPAGGDEGCGLYCPAGMTLCRVHARLSVPVVRMVSEENSEREALPPHNAAHETKHDRAGQVEVFT